MSKIVIVVLIYTTRFFSKLKNTFTIPFLFRKKTNLDRHYSHRAGIPSLSVSTRFYRPVIVGQAHNDCNRVLCAWKPTQLVVIIITILAFQLPSLAQDYKTLHGVVLSKETKEPLEFATIYLKRSTKGTVTNSIGQFEFYIPKSSLDDELVISFTGYDNYIKALNTFDFDTDLTIMLEPSTMLLKEVVIQEGNLTAKEIVKKAIKGINDNYPSKPISMEAFFREIEWENDKGVQVTEAALQIYDKNYSKKKSSYQEIVNTKAVRRSISYRQIEGFNDLGSAIIDLIQNNDVRYQRGMLNIKRNNYELDSISFYNDRPVYVISMSNKFDRGTLLIDLQTFTFIKIGLERKSRTISQPYYFKWDYQDSLKLGRVMFKFSVEFREIESKMYPSYMMEEEVAHVYDPITSDVIINKKERLEMIFNDIITNPNTLEMSGEKLTKKYRVPIGKYDEDFWKHYNVLKLTPLDARTISDLEQEFSLQDQFKQSKE